MLQPSQSADASGARRSPTDPWLSILIPAYNVEDYVDRCLSSVSSQLTDQLVEVVVLDDASTDGSRHRILASLVEARSVRVLTHATNLGISAARNNLLKGAKGEYIWFLDADDELLPGSLEQLRNIVNDHAPDLVICDYTKGRGRKSTFRGPVGCLSHDRRELIRGVFAKGRLHAWSKIARRDLWAEDLRFPVGECFEDIATIPWLLLRVRSFYYVGKPWLLYRTRAGSILSAMCNTRGLFDRQKNDQLAESLTGFWQAVENVLGRLDQNTAYEISHFCAHELRMIARRILRVAWQARSWRGTTGLVNEYVEKLQRCSPIPFRTLSPVYLGRLRIDRCFELVLILCLSKRPSGKDESDGLVEHAISD